MFLRDIVPIFPHGLYGMSLEDEVLFPDFFLTGTFKEHGQSEVVLELSYGNKFFFAGNLFISWSLFGDLDFHRSVLNEVPLAVVLETLVGTGTSSLALGFAMLMGLGRELLILFQRLVLARLVVMTALLRAGWGLSSPPLVVLSFLLVLTLPQFLALLLSPMSRVLLV